MSDAGGGPAAGWYADPGASPGSGVVRWWDGSAWTDHVAGGAPAPYAAGRVGPATPDGQELAGWWRRVAAFVLDSIVGVIAALPFTLPAQISVQREMLAQQEDLMRRIEAGETVSPGDFFALWTTGYADHWVLLIVAPAVVVLVYHALFLRWRGRTPGKMALGLRVRPRTEDGRLGWSVIARRLAVQFLLVQLLQVAVFVGGSLAVAVVAWLAVLVFSLADPLCALGVRRQTIHDRAAGTVVVRDDASVGAPYRS
ncbi:hypothetical protein GCM10009623_07890 [Nocardioides aestuarii]|uniref:RDD family protein n=1 Tax=Nocardioides aestuarii TaxID=252231 RepID=A0ABW4THY6_9ACTN